jgi:hypothetical protein
MLLSILPLVIIGMLILSFAAFSQFQQTIEQQIMSNRVDSTKKLSENIDTWLNGKLLEVRTSAETPTVKLINSNTETVDAFNKERMQLFNKKYPGEYDNAATGPFDNSGVMRGIYANEKLTIGDVKEKPWYKELIAGNEYVISNPVISKGTGKTLVVIAEL